MKHKSPKYKIVYWENVKRHEPGEYPVKKIRDNGIFLTSFISATRALFMMGPAIQRSTASAKGINLVSGPHEQ